MLRSKWQRARSVHSLMFSLASGRSLDVVRGAQPGRKPRPGEPPASGARQSVPLVADGLLLPQDAELRENQRLVGERRSGLTQKELVPARRAGGLLGRLLLISVLEGALE